MREPANTVFAGSLTAAEMECCLTSKLIMFNLKIECV